MQTPRPSSAPTSKPADVKRGSSIKPSSCLRTPDAHSRHLRHRNKCKFSHNLEAERKTQKASLYADKRDEGKDGSEKKEDGQSTPFPFWPFRNASLTDLAPPTILQTCRPGRRSSCAMPFRGRAT